MVFLPNYAIAVLLVLLIVQFVSWHCHGGSEVYKITLMVAIRSDW